MVDGKVAMGMSLAEARLQRDCGIPLSQCTVCVDIKAAPRTKESGALGFAQFTELGCSL